MLVHRELIALVIVAFSATNKVAASSTSSRHLRGPGTEFEDLLAVFVEEDEEERHLSALPPQRAPPMLRLLRLNQLSATNLAQTTRCVPASLPMPELDVTPSALKILLKTPVRATTCASLLCLTVKDLLMYSISSVSASNLKARICACILTADSFVSKEGLAS